MSCRLVATVALCAQLSPRHHEGLVRRVVLRRVAGWVLGLYVLFAVIGRFVEGRGAVRCGCADDCWCQQSGLSVFRWVFPAGHHPPPGPVRAG